MSIEIHITPPNVMRVANDVHWHYERYTSRAFLIRQAEDFIEVVGSVGDLDRVLYDYLESVARSEKARILGYQIDDEVFYTPRVIATLLPVALEIEDALAPSFDPTQEHTSGGSGIYGELTVSLLDIRSAWVNTAFRGSEMQLVKARYVEDMEWERLAATYGITVERAQEIVAQGLRRMMNFLGGRNPHRRVKK